MNKCKRCGNYFDEAETEHPEKDGVCSVCAAAAAAPLYRVRHVTTGRYLEASVSVGQVVLRWNKDGAFMAVSRDAAQAYATCLMHATGDAGVEIEPVAD
jgi:hypothetical protein